jgi:hypothetical protein
MTSPASMTIVLARKSRVNPGVAEVFLSSEPDFPYYVQLQDNQSWLGQYLKAWLAAGNQLAEPE